jgi:hypothetical protein
MRGKLVKKIRARASCRESRMRFKPDDEWMAQAFVPPALFFAMCSITARRLSRGKRHFAAFQSKKTLRSVAKN